MPRPPTTGRPSRMSAPLVHPVPGATHSFWASAARADGAPCSAPAHTMVMNVRAPQPIETDGTPAPRSDAPVLGWSQVDVHLEIVEGGAEPAADLLAAVARGERPSLLRLLVPEPTVAFGRLDALRDGFAEAQAAARRHGFAPLVRAPGGHAAAYHDGCLIVEEIVHGPDALPGVQDRFRERGE